MKKFRYLFSRTLLIILLLIGLSFLVLVFSDPLYCMDTFTEERLKMVAKISELESDLEYFKQQAQETHWLYNEALDKKFPDDIQKERLVAKRESEVNLNVGKKVLSTLKNRLESNDFNTSMSTSSSLGKRRLDD